MSAIQVAPQENHVSRLELPLARVIALNWETILFATLLILAVTSRFYDLGARTMSHDETSHVYFSWLLEQGRGYKHDPITHGPFQFHVVALSYFLFGDNDFSARIPAALFSIAAVAFLWYYRRYLGRAGTLAAAAMMLISPYMLYYGRYVRNEAFVAFYGVVTLWTILRYLESGQNRYLFWLTAITALHFATKETAFIYTAQALIFLALYLVYRITQVPWPRPEGRSRFLVALIAAVLLVGGGAIGGLLSRSAGGISATETAAPAIPGQNPLAAPGSGPSLTLPLILAVLGGLALLAAAYFLIRGYTWERLRGERSFAMLIVLGSMVLPMLAPFPVKFLGQNPLDYNNSQTIAYTAVFVAILAVIAIIAGMLWNPRLWLINAAIFYAIFTVFYTTVFTNGFGFVTGLVGSLGYWLEQQGVNRGNQPWYYYWLIQVPIYEYLPALGSILALILGLRLGYRPGNRHDDEEEIPESEVETSPTPAESKEWETLAEDETPEPARTIPERAPVLSLLGFWAVTALIAYSYAGEKMPWLTVHIALPMILLAGWALGQLIESIDWPTFRAQRGLLVIVLLPVFFASLLATFGTLLGTNPPFQGKDLNQLQATSTFVTALLTAVFSGWGLAYLVRQWTPAQIGRVFTLTAFALLGVLTARTAFMASYINYNDATEFLVYAHMSPAPKEIMNQIYDISRRTTDGLGLEVAYDSETSYPFWWYLRNFPNQRFYGDNPTRDLQNAQVILVGDKNYDKLAPVVRNDYYEFDYIRIWWPMQDYFDLSWTRVIDSLLDPQMREALFQIWLNRDYRLYGQITNKDFSLPNWNPSQHMRMYIRKDLVAKLWNYGASVAPQAVQTDPYQGKGVQLQPDVTFGGAGTEPGQFQEPHGIAVAPDGSLFIADTENSRIQHLDAQGNVIQVWGSFADISVGAAPPGTFNKPWDIAVGPDGSVYVADTWNHRIQKFTPDGQFVTMWGQAGQAETPTAFWGPRGVAVGPDGKVFVTDTGNKRVVVFDADGNYLTQFGEAGLSPGQFDEPVGVAVGSNGTAYVADTWNQRIQAFMRSSDGSYTPLISWDVAAWYGQSLQNKPYLAVDEAGNVFATDPESQRVLEFDSQGQIIRYWGDSADGQSVFTLAGAVAADGQGGVWVTDSGDGRVMHFTLPAP